MNPLPRVLGLALFVVLAVLTALLAVPVIQTVPVSATAARPAEPIVSRSIAQTPSPPPVQLAAASPRAALALALLALVLAITLVFSLAASRHAAGPAEPLAAARQEMGTLARLAESSAAQGVALSQERDVRRRAEEDAQLKQALLSQSLDEKIRLGRDLHDGIIQSLYAVGLTVETARSLIRSDPAQAERRLEEIRANLNSAIRDVRGYITGLTPENLRRASFSRGVATLFEQLKADRPAEFEIKVDDDAAAALSAEQSVEALQIAREAISNALRHGEATHVTLRMHQGDGEICLLVQDNGKGFDSARARDGGHGLVNMRARAGQVGASLRITSTPGQGTRILATFPARPESRTV